MKTRIYDRERTFSAKDIKVGDAFCLDGHPDSLVFIRIADSSGAYALGMVPDGTKIFCINTDNWRVSFLTLEVRLNNVVRLEPKDGVLEFIPFVI